jgi:3-methyladenine DNA glycosylase AlkD
MPTVASVIAELKKLSDPKVKAGMLRFGVPNDKAVGIPVGTMRTLAKKLGRDQQLAEGLWKDGLYEARMMACFLGDPREMTPALMNRWCKDFDSWAICDTACFALFDRTPHAWEMIDRWATRKPEFEKRAAFALLASVALHDKKAADELFLDRLPLIEAAADDERNFVKKGVSWALRGVGTRNSVLHKASLAVAERLAASGNATERWVGKDVLRDLQRELVKKRVARKSSSSHTR